MSGHAACCTVAVTGAGDGAMRLASVTEPGPEPDTAQLLPVATVLLLASRRRVSRQSFEAGDADRFTPKRNKNKCIIDLLKS